MGRNVGNLTVDLDTVEYSWWMLGLVDSLLALTLKEIVAELLCEIKVGGVKL